MSNRILAIALTIVIASPAMAQDLTYVKAGRMVDVVDGRLRIDQTIVIRGNRIERVGSASGIDIPAGAHVIDLSNATVLPGLIDMHVHLTGDPEAQGYATPR